jgi:hypothetical protein
VTVIKEIAIYCNRNLNNPGLAIQFRTDESGDFFDKMSSEEQRIICGNEYTGERHGKPAKQCPDWMTKTN